VLELRQLDQLVEEGGGVGKRVGVLGLAGSINLVALGVAALENNNFEGPQVPRHTGCSAHLELQMDIQRHGLSLMRWCQ
jgi:hypothetical protein